jgi:hypothetical protein
MKARFEPKPYKHNSLRPKTVYDWILDNFCLEVKVKFSYNNLVSRKKDPE